MSNIAFDMDGVIYDMGPVIEEVILNMYGKPTDESGIHMYDLCEYYKLNEKQIREAILVAQGEEYLLPEKFMPGAVRFLNKWGNDNPVIIITARPQVEIVDEFFKKNLDVDPRRIHIIFSTAQNKGECGYSLGLDMFIDDYWEALLSMMKRGIYPLLYDQPWNKKLPSDRSNVFRNMERMKSWEQVEKRLCLPQIGR